MITPLHLLKTNGWVQCHSIGPRRASGSTCFGLFILGRNFLFLATLLACLGSILSISACSEKQGVIAPDAIPKSYAEEHFSKWYATHGAERMAEAVQLAGLAAEKMVSSGKCSYLEYIDLSSKSYLGEFVFFGECTEGRIYLSESELDKDTLVRSQKELAWDHNKAYQACREMILQHVDSPGEIDIHDIIGRSINQISTTHRVVVHLDFDAIDAVGSEMKYTAKCYFDPGAATGTIDIFDRT